MFDFHITKVNDGSQIIDRTKPTSYDSLSPLEMVEYIEVDAMLTYFDRMDKMQEKAKKRTLFNMMAYSPRYF